MAFPHVNNIFACPYIESEDPVLLEFIGQDDLVVPIAQGWWNKKVSAALLFFLASNLSQYTRKHCTK